MSRLRPLIRLFTVIFGVLLGFQATAIAKTVVITRPTVNLLYDDLKTARQNNAAIQALRAGDTLILRWKSRPKIWNLVGKWEEKTYGIGEFLGEGNTTKVFSLQDDPTRALRLPKDWNNFYDRAYKTQSFIDSWIRGYNKLVQKLKAIPVVYEYVPELFIEVERIGETGAPTLEDLLANPDRFTELQRQEMLEALEKLGRETIDLIKVVDFHSGQLIYTKDRGWVLLDWTGNIKWRDDHSGFIRSKDTDEHFMLDILRRDSFYTHRRYNREARRFEDVRFTPKQEAWFQRVRDVFEGSVRNERWIVWGGRNLDRTPVVSRTCHHAQAQR